MKADMFAIAFLFILAGAYAAQDAKTGQVVVYKNDACAHCTPYLEHLLPSLAALGYKDVKIIDFINNKTVRADMESIQQKFGVPLQLQGHMLVDVEGKYLLEGHVPIDKVAELISAKDENNAGLVLYQDSMGEATQYTVWKDGKQFSCGVETKISDCGQGEGSLAGGGFISGGLPALLIVIAPVGLVAYYVAERRK